VKVTEIMTTNVECVAPDTGVRELADRMKTLDIGFLAVCENDRITGTITDRDIVIRGVAGSRDIASVKASDVMTKNVHCCSESDDAKDVAKKMRAKGVRRMLILDEHKRLAGVVSIGDISKVEESESGKTMKDIAEAA